MDYSVRNTVCYCCIWKGGRVLYSYTMGDHGIDNLAALCLETIPPFHRWYFETIDDNTFAFFINNGYVYFAIVRHSFGNSQLLRFLEKLKDEFTRVGKRGTSLDSLCLQEQLIPVVRDLVASLQRADTDTVWPSPSPRIEAVGASTKAPLLGRPSKHEKNKKKAKDHATVFMRDIEMEEHRRSSSGVRIDSGPLDAPNDQGTSSSVSPLHHKDYTSSRSSQNLHNKWCRQVRIILAIDAVVCVVLFIIWLVICRGIQCIR